ncbi:MAG: beta-glucosidase BglX [Rikenellaceae bacterium]|nr:beta-glucosidase BglX [Rikenellaceae bacterium]
MKRILTLLVAAAALAGCGRNAGADRDAAMDRFVDELMARMTVDEKIGQLNLLAAPGDIVTGEAQNSDVAGPISRGEVGGLFNLKGVDKIRDIQRLAVEKSRLGIPLIFGMDVIHGYETTFPIPLALTATWDTAAMREAARIAAREASASGICWTFSPMADISRDPRWGRVAEGVGEDPYLGAEMVRAMVYGYQGADPSHYATDEIMACVKHFALYGASEAGRDYNTVDMSRQRMYNDYFPTYRAAVDAGVGSVMASFNEIDGVPATANRWLLTDVLRDQWGFDGLVVSDYSGIMEMTAHGIGDLPEVSARALRAGNDMDMMSFGYIGTLRASLDAGLVTEAEIDRACRLVLEAKYKLGLFDDPYRYCDAERTAREVFAPEHRARARQIAAESFVLLKNENDLLPLRRGGVIAVVGPLAASRENMPGTWSVATDLRAPSTLVEGLRAVAGGATKVVYARGSNVCHDGALERAATTFGRDIPRDGRSDRAMIDEAVRVARSADVVVAALGEPSEMSGESSSRTDLGIPDAQRELLEALVATGKPVVLVLFAGRPMTLSWEAAHVPAILNVWFGGTEAAEAIADVLLGDASPGGRLPSSFPRNVGQIPVYYNHKNTGRPAADADWFAKFRSNYLDVPNSPLYPFGYGLTYTTFEYGEVSLSSDRLARDGAITATVRVTNTGARDGVEVVQLYTRDRVGSVTRPVQELKGFRRVPLRAGESADVSFTITPDMLRFYNAELAYVAEPGEFDVMIGGSSDWTRSVGFTLE